MASNTDDSFQWEKLREMPTKRVFSTPVAVDDKIYVVGGCDHTGVPMDTFEVYNTKNNRWTSLKSSPRPRAGSALAAVGKKIYAIGGVGKDQKPLPNVDEYDIETKEWTVKNDLSTGLIGVSVVVKDDKILAVGGMKCNTDCADSFMIYDPERDVWISKEQMPSPRYASGCFLVNGKLYVLGGRFGRDPVAAAEVYDFKTNSWKKLPDIPSKRVFPMYVASDKHIFSIGGLISPQQGFSDACEVFDIEKEEWTETSESTKMPTNRGDAAIGIMDGKVVIAGGLGKQGAPLKVVEAFDVTRGSWTTLPELPTTHCSCAHLMYHNKLYVIGGLSVKGPSGCFESIRKT